MNKFRKSLLNIVVIIILGFLLVISFGYHFSPLSAYKSSERKFNYGPSQIKHIETLDDRKYYLSIYDKWVSVNRVSKWFVFWRLGSPYIFEYDTSKPFDFSWSASDTLVVYGIINDDRIKRIELTSKDGIVISQDEIHDQLFLITWKYKDNNRFNNFSIKGYDEQDRLIYEDEY